MTHQHETMTSGRTFVEYCSCGAMRELSDEFWSVPEDVESDYE